MIERVKPGYGENTWGDLPRLRFPPMLANPVRARCSPPLPDTELIVVCVCVGPKFPAYYVERIRRMAERNLSVPFRFACVTDRSDLGLELLEIIKPQRALPGWYSKINLFNPGNFPAGARVLYLDLDVVVTDNLDPFLCAREPFVMIREFHPRPETMVNSSVMAWTAGNETTEIFHKFEDDWMRRSWGDQECMWTIMGNERIANWPDEMVRSYKYHCGSGIPKNCRIVVMHGDPKPDAINDEWVVKLWV